MELSATRKGQRLTAVLKGELDHHSAQTVRAKLDAYIADPLINELELDLSGVCFMDSAGLGVVLGRYRTLRQRGGRLLVTGVSTPVDRIFRMSGVYTLLRRA